MNKRNDIELILVGDELLKGERSDAHLAWLGRTLLRTGVRIARAQAVGDAVEAITEAVRESAARARVVIVTGGLGPTVDDVTRDGVAAALGLELAFDEPTWEGIVAFFAARGFQASESNRRQAMFPRGAHILGNAQGTAPGFAVERDDLTVFVLPGPPLEMRPMVEADVRARVAEIFAREALRVETFRTAGIGESQMVSMLGPGIERAEGYVVSFLPSLLGVDVVLTQAPGAGADAPLAREAERVERLLREHLGAKLYEHGERSLAQVVHDLLVARGETLGVAESLTGGSIGKALTDFAGASAYFLAAAVTYSDASKRAMLGVAAETLARFGAVSEETCTEMAHGMRRAVGATYGVATTGIAGPTGGSAKKPVGLCYLGLAWDGGCHVKRVRYRGARDTVRLRATHGALWLLYDHMAAR